MSGMNISNAEAAYLKGSAQFEDWLKKFEAQWNQPLTETAVLILWEKMTPEMKAWYQKNNPEAYADLEAFVNEIRARNSGTNGGE